MKKKDYFIKLMMILGYLFIFHLLVVVFICISLTFPSLSAFLTLACIATTCIAVLLGLLLENVRLKMRIIAIIALSGLMCVWASGFISGFLCNIAGNNGIQMVSSKVEFPLGELEGITIDTEGKIYCVASFYSRLQIYDHNGHFLIGWFIPLPKGLFNIGMYKDKYLRFSADTGWSYLYDQTGNLVKKSREKNYYEQFGRSAQSEVQDSLGNIYRIKNSVLFPRVVKITQSGKQTVLISDSLYMWLIKGPFPSLILATLTGIFMIIIWRKLAN